MSIVETYPPTTEDGSTNAVLQILYGQTSLSGVVPDQSNYMFDRDFWKKTKPGRLLETV